MFYSLCREFKAYSEDDLWQVITEQAWVDKKLSPTITLSDVVSPWLNSRIPLVTVTTDYSTNITTFSQVRLKYIYIYFFFEN